MDQLTLGLAVRALREAKQFSAKDLSISAGLPEYAVSRIETGKIRLDFAAAFEISRALGVTLDELADVAERLSPSVRDKKEELEGVRAQLKAIHSELLAQAKLL